MMLRRALRIGFVLAVCLSITSPAYAYLDPGTGSMLLSAVIGVAAATNAVQLIIQELRRLRQRAGVE